VQLAFSLLLAAAVVGCNRGSRPKPDKQPDPTPETPSTNKEDATAAAPVLDKRLTQTFAEARRPNPPADWPGFKDTTATGKSTAKLYTEVERLWKDIPFATPDGKRINYSATLETDQGVIEMTLLPDVAPNHVRNFVALARAGYYDGLVFEHIVHEEVTD